MIPRPHNQTPDVYHEVENFVQSALDALAAHIAILNREGEIIAVNRAWRDFADGNGFKDPTYGIGSNYLSVCDASSNLRSKDAPLVATGIRDVIYRRAEEFELEYPCHSPIEKRWFVVRVSRFEWAGELRLVVAHQNVSELKQVQIELATSKSRIEGVLNNINNGIITINPRGYVESANPAAARIYRCQMADMLGSHLSDWIDEPFLGQKTLKKLNGEMGHEIMGRRHDGTTFPIYFSLNELKLDDGTIYTGIIQDITFRKQMEAEMIEKQKMAIELEKERELRELKNRFLSMMSHELRTPLASIQLSYDMLKQYSDKATEEEKQQYLDNIRVQVGHLSEMVADVVTLSKSESEGLGFEPEDADLITYCRNVIEEFQLTYHKTHHIEFECEEAVIIAALDRRLLRRSLTNLISNAIKYSPNGGRVLFRLYVEDQRAFIQVKDSGIGIPEDDVVRLFQPFHRASNVDQFAGTGLGLAIAKQVVESHGGKIHVESQVGQGTTFTFWLPLSATDPHIRQN